MALTEAEVEEAADGLNQSYCADIGAPPLALPIPVEEIAEQYLGYEIEFTDRGIFSDPRLLGGIDLEAKTIFVNASVQDHDGRYSFTVAHEIGHHVLHREAHLAKVTEEGNSILCREVANKPRIEIEADRFAAALLMPASLVSKAVRNQKSYRHIKSIGQARGLAATLIKHEGFENVSNTAMVNRFIDLKYVPYSLGYQDGVSRPRRGFRPSMARTLRLSTRNIRGIWNVLMRTSR